MKKPKNLIPLLMRYKGARNYLQGGDIYNAVVAAVIEYYGPGSYAGQLAFHRFATNQCNLFVVPSDEQPIVPEDRVCDGQFRGNKGNWTVWLVETDHPVESRYAFDEDEICATSVIGDKTVSATKALDYSPIEVAIALTKHLHNNLFPLDTKRWIFAKLEFSRLFNPDDAGRIQINLLTNLHNRITKSELRSGDELIGYIYFSAVPK
jgi:hypothetical protein